MSRFSHKQGARFAGFALGALFASAFACKSAPGLDDELNGDDGSGGFVGLGGSVASGGKIVLPIGSGGASGGAQASSGGAQATGFLVICDVPSGPSVGDPSQSLLIDNFDDAENSFEGNGLNGSWYGYNDESVSGVQIPTGSEIRSEPGGPGGTGYALHVQGEGFSDWGSGFVGQFAATASGQACLFDASAYSGVSFWVKGSVEADPAVDGERYDPDLLRLLVIEKDVVPRAEGGDCDADEGACWDSHRIKFPVDPCWRLHAVTFDELLPDGYGFDGGQLDLNELYNVNFEIGRGNRYDLWIDEVSFFVGTPPTAEPICDVGGEGGAPASGN